MKSNEALELIEKWQIKFCHITQSIIQRNEAQFSPETVTGAKTLGHDLVHCLGSLKQEIYRFIQRNPEVKISCNYEVDKRVSQTQEDGEIKSVQSKLLKILSEAKVELPKIGLETIVSQTDNQQLRKTEIFKSELENFLTLVDKLSDLILKDINCRAVTINQPVAEAPVEEKVVNPTDN